jgi:multiple sugar transport system substrate-binding protein
MKEKKENPPLTRRISRRDFMKAAGLVGAGMVAAGCSPQATPAPTAALPTAVPAPTTMQPTAASAAAAATAAPATAPAVISAAKAGLAAGMIGGPTGFDGSERYQYGPDTPAGRAMAALKALPKDKKPASLVFMMDSGATGHWTVPFPTAQAPTVQSIFEEESGIKINFVSVGDNDMFTKVVQDATTKAGGYDILTHWLPDKGSLYEAGALLELDNYVAQYKPEWEKSYVGGAGQVQQFNYYAGKCVLVDFDGDYQVWTYRTDLFEDPKEQSAFKAKYGWDLQWPETWEQFDQVATFFNRPDQNLVGSTDLRSAAWDQVHLYQRFCCMLEPNAMLFEAATAKPLIDSPAGVETMQWLADSLKWHTKDALSWGWPEQYAHFATGGAAMTCGYPNISKSLDNKDNKDSKVTGKMKTGLVPGKLVNGKLIRRGTWWPNIAHSVSSQSKYPEAAYLLLQWGGSANIFGWMVGNPAGYYDPFQTDNLTDPIVVASYKQYGMDNLKATIEHSVPCINMAGNNDYIQSWDNHFQAVVTGKETAAQAVKAAAAEWEKVTDRVGRDKQIAALQGQLASWPTITDTPKITA